MPFSFPELLVLFIVLFVIFGAKKLPEVGRSLGSGIREYRNTIKEFTRDP